MALLSVYSIRNHLMVLLKGYFTELKDVEITIDTTLEDLNLGETWLIEYVFIVEEKYNINITMDMAKKHFVRIRNAAKYLSNRELHVDYHTPSSTTS